jgi:dihydroorotase-like cyclic amidohydrolase
MKQLISYNDEIQKVLTRPSEAQNFSHASQWKVERDANTVDFTPENIQSASWIQFTVSSISL